MLALLALLTGWPVMVGVAVSTSAWRGAECDSGHEEERRLFRRVAAPLVAGIVVVSALLGWALVEPADAERVPMPFVVAAVVPFVVVMRALVRAAVALFPRALPPACTVGVLRPRVHVAPSLASALSGSQLRAVLAHEESHAHHHDPLRIAVAQLACDLVWPLPWQGRTLRLWLHALEVARDEDARRAGAEPESLAEAVIACARLSVPRSGAAVAAAAAEGPSHRLEERIGRLLRPLPAERRSRGGLLALAVASVLAVAVAAGALAGEDAVQLLTRSF